MLDALVGMGPDPHLDQELLREIDAHTVRLRHAAGRGEVRLVREAESAVQKDGRVLSFDPAGAATLRAAGHTWAAGRFEPVAIGTLRARALAARSAQGGALPSKVRPSPPAEPSAPQVGAGGATGEARLRMWVIDGAAAATDIGSLQANAGKGALFQVASQFNCLEAPGPAVVPVARYLTDPTQGPRASISAFPGTLLRHYAAPGPGGQRFVQVTGGPQIELLGDVCAPHVGRAQDGYLTADGVADPKAFVAALEEGFDRIKVGLHDGLEVVLGYNWEGAVEGRPIIVNGRDLSRRLPREHILAPVRARRGAMLAFDAAGGAAIVR